MLPHSRDLSKLPFFYGWIAVCVGSMTMFFTTPGQSDTFGIFFNSFIEDLGWSRTMVSSVYSIATLLSGCLMFFVGRLIDRFGSRRSSLFSAALLGAACIVNSFVTTPVMLFFGFFLSRFSGKGALDLSANTVAPQWFERKRALAIMLVGFGGTLGGIVFPLLNNYLISSYGWRSAFRMLGFGTWIIYLPIAFIFFISRPEDVGLKPDGAGSPARRSKTPPSTQAEISFQQGQAVRTVAFWILAFCIFQSSLVGTGAILHFVSIFQQAGYTMSFAARIMSMRTIIGLVTFLLMGLVLDKVKKTHYVLAIACIVQAVGSLMLAFLDRPGMAILHAIFAGASSRVVFFCVGVLMPRLFGRKYIGGVLGVAAAINVIGSAVGPFIFGAAFDLFGGYLGVILISSLLPVISGVWILFIRKPAAPDMTPNDSKYKNDS
jgi:MFS family permease